MNNIVLHPAVFTEQFIPTKAHDRYEHLDQLNTCLAPATRGRRPLNALLIGPSGSGKTLVAKLAFGKLREAGVPAVYVNCWESDSLYAILEKIVRDLGVLNAERIDTAFKGKAIEHYLRGRPLVVFLDEVDKLMPKERNVTLYSLLSLGTVGLACLAEDRHFFQGLEDRVQARLYPTQIGFGPYHDEDILAIIRDRCTAGLSDRSVGDAELRYIASQSGGSARIALEILRRAASLAEQKRAPAVGRQHVEQACLASNGSRIDYLLDLHGQHFRMIYTLIKEHPGILSNELWQTYRAMCQNLEQTPVASRTLSWYLRKLFVLRLITAERAGPRGNLKRYRAVA